MKVNIVQNTKGEILAVFNSESPVTPEVASSHLGFNPEDLTISSHLVIEPQIWWKPYPDQRSIQDPLQ